MSVIGAIGWETWSGTSSVEWPSASTRRDSARHSDADARPRVLKPNRNGRRASATERPPLVCRPLPLAGRRVLGQACPVLGGDSLHLGRVDLHLAGRRPPLQVEDAPGLGV